MKNFDPGQRARRLGTALLLLLLSVLPASARGKSDAWANTKFSAAEGLREALTAQPAAERSRHEYLHVINAYRRVYYGAPASPKAGSSVVAVADLLTEMGRSFNSPADLHAAVGQYKFLRREYPGSRERFDALSSISQKFIRTTSKTRPRQSPSLKNFFAAIRAVTTPLPTTPRNWRRGAAPQADLKTKPEADTTTSVKALDKPKREGRRPNRQRCG